MKHESKQAVYCASGDCRWTYQQNQAVLAALKKENKELKALLAQLPAGTTNGRVSARGYEL